MSERDARETTEETALPLSQNELWAEVVSRLTSQQASRESLSRVWNKDRRKCSIQCMSFLIKMFTVLDVTAIPKRCVSDYVTTRSSSRSVVWADSTETVVEHGIQDPFHKPQMLWTPFVELFTIQKM